jgi:ATP-dependent Lon protease
MLCALASTAVGKPVRRDLAMTGEITLRGEILPVGGIKEKVLAALRAGINEVCLPRENQRDLSELPAPARGKLQAHLLSRAEGVLNLALVEPPAAKATNVS